MTFTITDAPAASATTPAFFTPEIFVQPATLAPRMPTNVEIAVFTARTKMSSPTEPGPTALPVGGESADTSALSFLLL